MAQRSKSDLVQTPNYGLGGRPDFLTVKLHYNGEMKYGLHDREYIGGQVDYFDYVDKDVLGMIELWGYAEDVGCNDRQTIKFCHKFGESLKDGKYLENDIDVMEIIPHIHSNYEVEIYIEQNDGANSQTGLGSILIRMETCVGQSAGYNKDDENVDEFDESDYEFDEDDSLFETFVDHDVGVNKETDLTGDGHISDELLQMMQQHEGDVDCVNDGEFRQPLTSDNDDEMPDFLTYDPKIDSEDPQLKLGLIFNSKKDAKFVIESHCVRRGMSVKFVKNDGKRLRAKCTNNGCTWVIHVSMMTNDNCWQVKTFEDKHNNCVWRIENKCITSTWLGKTFAKKFMTNPKLGSLEFKNEIHASMNAEISRKVAYLAKRKALKLIEGSVDEQFGKIRNYCAELKRTDKDATIILKLTEDEGRPRFQRMYVCFSACKLGFQDTCRPVIGVDGYFLKSNTGGQLLSAVGLDPNNNIFPICYALVEGETKDTWMWFMQLLASDINLEDDYAWTFMSDKQKGLIHVLESLFPNAEHIFCVRRMHSNMKNDGYKSVAVKNALWAAAKATRVDEFRKRMQELREIDRNAYEWLAKKPESHWSKTFFSTTTKCDILLNNMCECFNSLILDAREKPIIEMFETIRNLLMRRFQFNREKAEKWQTRNCPRIRAISAKTSLEAAKLISMKADDMHFQIKAANSPEQYTVDFCINSCSCRQWDLTGIPCKHALCALWSKDEDAEAFVSHYYTTEAYKKCYSRSIMPINGSSLWPDCELPSPLPPMYNKNKAGRPAKLRRREPDEPPARSITKLKSPRRQNKCKSCGQFGHNQRTCTFDRNTTQEAHSQQSNPTNVDSVKRPSKIGIHIGGSSNTLSNVNVDQSTIIKKPVFVKCGRNYTTISRLRSTPSDPRRRVQSASQPVSMPSSRPVSKPASQPVSKPASQSCVGKK